MRVHILLHSEPQKQNLRWELCALLGICLICQPLWEKILSPQNQCTKLRYRASKGEANLPDGRTKGMTLARGSAELGREILVNHTETDNWGDLCASRNWNQACHQRL
jgi:hypothetical protein